MFALLTYNTKSMAASSSAPLLPFSPPVKPFFYALELMSFVKDNVLQRASLGKYNLPILHLRASFFNMIFMDQILMSLNSCRLQIKPILQRLFGHQVHSAEHSNFLYYDTLQCSAWEKLQEYISSLKAIPFRESSTHTNTHIFKFPSFIVITH